MVYNIDKKHNIVRAILTLRNTLIGDKWFEKKSYIGTAKCCPEDTFDEEKGKVLAKKRCLIKYYTDQKKLLRDFNNKLNSCIDENEQRIVNCEFKLLNLSAEIDEICI